MNEDLRSLDEAAARGEADLSRILQQMQEVEKAIAHRVAAAVNPLAARVNTLNARIEWLLLATLLALVITLVRGW